MSGPWSRDMWTVLPEIHAGRLPISAPSSTFRGISLQEFQPSQALSKASWIAELALVLVSVGLLCSLG